VIESTLGCEREKGEGVERLNSQLEQALANLLVIEKRGGNATNYIFDVLSGTSGGEREYRYMRELIALGYITGFIGEVSGEQVTEVDGLSSRAYSYFDDLAAEKKRRKRERNADRRWSILTIFIGAIIGILSTVAGQVLLRLV
jgi:hypothetical protein